MARAPYTERDVCSKLIAPAIKASGWREEQIREEVYFTAGRIIVRGKLASRRKGKRADYLLSFKANLPLAVVEAKDESHSVEDGMQQALQYAEILDLPFAFSSNGSGFTFHDRTGLYPQRERYLSLEDFPPPDELWQKYCEWKGLSADTVDTVTEPYYEDGSGKTPRYYQLSAINRTVEAIAKGQKRALLVMATGTGKTFTAFQIIWRLWKSRRKKRILFLADRNVLIDQTMVNDFRPFAGAMAKLSTKNKTIERNDGSLVDLPLAVNKRRKIDTSYEIYLGLYQSLTGDSEAKKLYKSFSPDFFDLIVIDECHRGSAADDSAWREILEYFSDATQIGLTATPKETEYVSNMNYFGDPVYTYSLKQGIDDGFLAPYKVIKIHIDKDIEGYRPEPGQIDRDGNEIEDRVYNRKDMDRTIVIDERTELVASKVTQFLKESGDRMQKTIVFCVDTEHAGRMRQALINQNQDLYDANSKYVMRITGNDAEGQAQLDNFIDPLSANPVIVTTSRLLSTGVDAQTCRLIVLDREVGSMTEFKQIVGRGTRVHEDSGKCYFTLMDFRGATNHFSDPDFDGDPVQIYEPKGDAPVDPPDDRGGISEPGAAPIGGEPPEPTGGTIPDTDKKTQKKFRVNGVPATIIGERIEYLGADGKLITESLRDYTRKTIQKEYQSLDHFLKRWSETERRSAIFQELDDAGLPMIEITEELNKDLDPFDMICHIAFDAKPLTRKERANKVRKRDVFGRYSDKAKAVLNALLDKYSDDGVLEFSDPKVLNISPFSSLGMPMELIMEFGGPKEFRQAANDLQSALYDDTA